MLDEIAKTVVSRDYYFVVVKGRPRSYVQRFILDAAAPPGPKIFSEVYSKLPAALQNIQNEMLEIHRIMFLDPEVPPVQITVGDAVKEISKRVNAAKEVK